MPLSRITAASIADGTIVASDIADGSITGPKLGVTSINANNIVDATITGDKIGVGQITSNLFAAGAVSTSNISSGNSNVSVTSANGNVTIGTAGSERMRITSAGDVGIGTANPGQRLEVLKAGGGAIRISETASRYVEINGYGEGAANGSVITFNTITAGTSSLVECGRFDNAGNFKFNSGYGSVATAYGCRAWVNFNGTTNTGGFCTIRGSGNVSSVNDRGVGDYQVNFATAMPDLLFATTTNFHPSASNAGSDSFALNPISTLYAEIYHYENNSLRDSVYACAFIFR